MNIKRFSFSTIFFIAVIVFLVAANAHVKNYRRQAWQKSYRNALEGNERHENRVRPSPTATPGPVYPTDPSVLDMIRVDSPRSGDTVSSPLTITGEARGNWFFEATFPVILVNWDGLIIAEHYAEAQDDWMTEDFVPFRAELDFERPFPDDAPDFMKNGSLILQKANPSGLPEHDAALEFPVRFE